MNNNPIDKNYYNWDVSQGDYHRDFDEELEIEKKIKIKKRFRGMVRILFFLGIFVATLSFLAFYFF